MNNIQWAENEARLVLEAARGLATAPEYRDDPEGCRKTLEELETELNNALELFRLFNNQKHSEPYSKLVVNWFASFVDHDPITPVGVNEDEWELTLSSASQGEIYQNKRDPHFYRVSQNGKFRYRHDNAVTVINEDEVSFRNRAEFERQYRSLVERVQAGYRVPYTHESVFCVWSEKDRQLISTEALM